jgi:hypothetical protein
MEYFILNAEIELLRVNTIYIKFSRLNVAQF